MNTQKWWEDIPRIVDWLEGLLNPQYPQDFSLEKRAEILKEKISETTKLCYDKETKDIQYLGIFTELTSLEIKNYKYFRDLRCIGENKKLEKLILSDNNIMDISPLKKLLNLTYLDLENNSITHISDLECLTNLTYLNIKKNYIDPLDIEKLKKALPNCEILF